MSSRKITASLNTASDSLKGHLPGKQNRVKSTKDIIGPLPYLMQMLVPFLLIFASIRKQIWGCLAFICLLGFRAERVASSLDGFGDDVLQSKLVSKIRAMHFKKLVVGLWVGSAGPPYGVHRFTRPFCRRCAPGLNWLGRASGAVTLKKLECSKQAYALRTTAKAFAKDVFINQERKLGARRRSDTVLVSTINDADQGSADVAYRTPLAPYEKSKFLGSGGSMVARLKLKGIDGRAPPGVEPAA
ncbi:hypothetical protein Tco_0084558 [Tanacetum coccineum]